MPFTNFANVIYRSKILTTLKITVMLSNSWHHYIKITTKLDFRKRPNKTVYLAFLSPLPLVKRVDLFYVNHCHLYIVVTTTEPQASPGTCESTTTEIVMPIIPSWTWIQLPAASRWWHIITAKLGMNLGLG